MTPAPIVPSLADLLGSLRVVSVPMRVRFRGITVREVGLLRGPVGWGEFGPFLEYGPDEAARWLASAVESAYAGWPAPVRHLVPVNATVPAVPADEVGGVIDRFDGCTTAKVKVAERGQTLTDDLDRVAAVRDHMGPGARIRIDANGGWDAGVAVQAIGALAAYGLEYAEQPCRTVEELREVRITLARRGIDVPIAADESIRKATDPIEVARREAADIVVVKVAPLGGVRGALRVVQECRLPAVVSSALDTSVGMAAGVALASALPDLPHACGLGTVALLDGDVVRRPLVPAGGVLHRADADRLEVDAQLLDRYAAPADRVTWWRERLRDAYAALSAVWPNLGP